jgi:hypothetical protein
MSIIAVPTMSTRGFITDSSRLDSLMAHAFEADANQTFFYAGKVTSAQKLIQEQGNDVNGLVTSMTAALNNYLIKYFSSVNVNITLVDNPNSSGVTLVLQIGIKEDISQKIYSYSLVTSGSNILKFAKINQG